jgi:hypothetical protein
MLAEGCQPRNRAELMTKRAPEGAIAAPAEVALTAVPVQDWREVVVEESAAGRVVLGWTEARLVVEKTAAETHAWTPGSWAAAGVPSWDWLGQVVIR